MRWQDALTKKQLAHMGKFQPTLTLRAFRIQRLDQKELYAKNTRAGLNWGYCRECEEIETRLLAAGVKL